MDNKKIIVGRLSGAFGIKGWIKVSSYTEPLQNIFSYQPWYLRPAHQSKHPLDRSQWQSCDVVNGQMNNKGLIVQLAGITDRDQAALMNGFEIAVPITELPSLDGDDYYWHQLQGLLVRNKQGQCFGKVKYLLETGANDVLVVQGDRASIDQDERLIPYLPGRVVDHVDLQNGIITVDWQADY